MLSLLLSRTGLAIGGIGLAVIIGYSWHRSIVRAEQQRVEAETLSRTRAELEAQYAADKKKDEARIIQLEELNADLMRNKAASVQRFEIVTKQIESNVADIKNLDDDAVLDDLREALARRRAAGTATVNTK